MLGIVIRRSFSCCCSRSLSLAEAIATSRLPLDQDFLRAFPSPFKIDGEGAASALTGVEDVSSSSTLISSLATLVNALDPGARPPQSIFSTALTSLSSSRISLPSCLSSTVWYKRAMPHRVSRSGLFKQKENAIFLSSRSSTI